MGDFDMVVRGDFVTSAGTYKNRWLAVLDGKIAALGKYRPPRARELVDARGNWVMPGVVDGRIRASGMPGGAGLEIASRAAAAGGATVVVDMHFEHAQPVVCRMRLEAVAADIARRGHVDVAVAGTLDAEHGLMAAMELMEGGICAISIPAFEAGRDPLVRFEDDLYATFRALAPLGLACGMHYQVDGAASRASRRLLGMGGRRWDALRRRHTQLIEGLATRLLCRISAVTGARTHVADVSTPRGFDLCAGYRQAGFPVSVETGIRSLVAGGDMDPAGDGSAEARDDVEHVWRRLANDECTFVSSGFMVGGQPDGYGPDVLLPALWTGCAQRGIEPAMVVRLLCHNPACHFFLNHAKGSFDIGKDADLVILAPQRSVPSMLNRESGDRISAADPRAFSVRVAGTWCRGRQVFDGRRVTSAPGYGRYLRANGGDDALAWR
ncbi:amidohydrolase family protein [Achromobacter sp. UMC46]|uniref:amidohydrolase family protein n=1 Tax=Achromobacter sp. UMC46 TaxID=1862319 RepID=UPI001602E9BF|nr:amidohydrolase family protein [Achromobacter sp. UMC46]MBB1592827.1 hypothetical protein [Achromobacter sp. UMC46]